MITGSRLAQLRREKKMTQKDLANYLNVAASTVSNYENSVNSIDIATLDRMADFFEVTTDYLIGRTDERQFTASPKKPEINDIYVKEITDTVLTLDPASRSDVLKYARFMAQQTKNKH